MALKILFVMKHPGAIRNFDSTVRLLTERGHMVQLAFAKGERLEGAGGLVRRLCDQYPTITQSIAPASEDEWSALRRKVRTGIDYLPYLEPRYQDAPRLRERIESGAPIALRRRAGRFPLSTAAGRRALHRVLRVMDQCIPTNPAIDAYLRDEAPDVLLITPLVENGSSQADFVRSAQALGIRTGLCVHSWDNLTNKGLIRDVPDIVAVWNNAQQLEAVQYHGVPAERVVVSGAMPFDQWFERKPSTSRDAFCATVGLRSDRPYVIYLCSSTFIAGGESGFVRQWLGRMRAADDPDVREAGVLIRPHPQNAAQWHDLDLSEFGNVTVWPRAGADPTDDASRTTYFDSMYHSTAVVGVNTTALIESAVVGRPVYTLLAPEFVGTQEGTLHFRHLTEVNGGLLHVASTFEEHLVQLGDVLRRDGEVDQKSRAFVAEFVRPHGLDVPATPYLVNAIESLCAQPAPAPQRPHPLAGVLRPYLRKRARGVNASAASEREKAKATGKPGKEPGAPRAPKEKKAKAQVEAIAAQADASSGASDGQLAKVKATKIKEAKAVKRSEPVAVGEQERQEAR